MKKQFNSLFVAAALVAMIISACGGAPVAAVSSDKPLASLVEFTGVIEAIDGNQWTINGEVITVDPAVLRDGPFAVGDTVKVEVEVQTDGSVVVTRVEPPVAAVDAGNINDDNSNSSNTNDDNSNSSLGNLNGNTNDNTNSGLGTGIGTNANDNTNSSLSGRGSHHGNSNDDDDDDDNSNSSSGNGNGNDDDDDDDDDNSGSGGNSGSGDGDDD